MFAIIKPRTEIITRVVLIAVIIFNALVPTTALASPSAESKENLAKGRSSAGFRMKQDPDLVETPVQTSSGVASSSPSLSPVIGEESNQTDSPSIELSIDPDFITPGGSLVLSWTVSGLSIGGIQLISLQLTLPESFSLEGSYVGQFDPVTRILTIPVSALEGQVNLKAGDSTSDVMLKAVLFQDTEAVAQTSLFMSVHEKFLLDQNGGKIETQDGKIKVEFSKDTLPEQALIDIGKPSGDAVPPYLLSGEAFEIKAHSKQSGQELKNFPQEISIFVSYADLGISAEMEDNLYLHWYNAETQDWEALPSVVNKQTKTLRAFTDHFTVFDIDVYHWQASRLPTIDSFQVSNFTGAATYSLPIEVPPGPGGFQPSLSLNYNSQIVDQSTTLTQASWVGMGWSLETGSVERDTHGTPDERDDTFFLNVGGISTRLVKDPNNIYHATDENFWQVSYNGNWTVKDKQGNIYFFERSYQYPFVYDEACQWQHYLWVLTKVRNSLGQEIYYSYADQIKTARCISYDTNVITATYPDTITYANSRYRIRFARQNRQDYTLSWDTDLVFHTYQKQRLQNIYIEQDANVDGSFETTLRRYEFVYANNTDADVVFPGVNWTAGGKTTTLRSVREYGVGGAAALPATTFTYGDNLHLTRADNGYGGAVEFSYGLWYYPEARTSHTIHVNFGDYGYPCRSGGSTPWVERVGAVGCEAGGPLLIRGPLGIATAANFRNCINVENCWPKHGNMSKDLIRPGGVYKITTAIAAHSGVSVRVGLYDGVRDNWASYSSPSYFTLPADASKVEPLIEETGGNFIDITNGGAKYAWVYNYNFQLLTSIYRVSQKRVYDGVQSQPYLFTYGYSNPAVNDPANSPNNNCSSCSGGYFEWYSEFRGHSQVIENSPGGGQTITTFYQDEVLRGRPISTTIKSGSQILSMTNYHYASTLLPVSPPYPAECSVCSPYVGVLRTWVRTDWVENRIYANDGTYNAARQVLAYEPSYGNLITQTDQSWNGSTWTNYRTTSIDYFPNPSAYLVSLPARQQIKDSSNTVIAESLSIYDSNSTYNAVPSVGKLTAVRTWVDGILSTGRYSQVAYSYDGWGNQTTVTSYSGYGTASTAPTEGARTTATVFDSTFHVYPISQTTPPTQNAPSGLTTTWAYDYDNNGTNDFILGVPTRETDPNGNPTLAQYDAFGRMTKLIRPGNGDSVTNPTIAIDYHDTNPFWTEIRQRIDGTRYLTIRRHYDGIGRPTYIENGSTNGGTFTLNHTVSYLYPAFNIAKQSMPYPPGGTAFYTTTISDVLGRPLTVTAPNGNETSYAYNGLVNIATDPKGNSTTSATDVWGRVVSMIPPTGPSVTYSYDELNNLKIVLRGGVTTEIKYDRAGRKIGMDDPDMGMGGVIGDDNWGWTYQYDALGNLTSQTDARSCVMTLDYDILSRLKSKNSSGACGTQVTTSYTYDVGTNGLGRRTSMNDDSGSTSWTYDVRGRVTQESKIITGISQPFLTSWEYNSADLPYQMTYPDNEVLSYAYNDMGQLNSVSSSLGDTYLASTQYDEAGRIKQMDYGASILRKTFNYFPWNTTDQGGLLNTVITTRLADSATLQSFAYTFDKNANISTITDNQAGPQTQTFGYDSLNRLTSATVTGGTNGLYNESYQYNATTGNLSVKGGLSYSYNDPDHAHAVTSAGSNTYAYDPNGNMTQRMVNAQTFNLAYDAENRLVSVNTNSAPLTPTPTSTAVQTNTLSPTVTNTPTATNTPGGPTATPTPTPQASNQPLYLSLLNNTTLGSVTVQDTDILYFNGTTWSMYFDASDVGISSNNQDLSSFHFADADTILMTFTDSMTLGSLTVEPVDIVQFDATSLGENTTGTFSLYFDGSDVGLEDTVNEDIDAFDVLLDGRLLISTSGSSTLPGLSGSDEDLIAFTPTGLGENTSGSWAMYFDGSKAGIGLGNSAEDIDGVDVAANGDLYLSANDLFDVPGISGNDEDVFVCTPAFVGGAVDSCTYGSVLYFDGSTWGLDANDVEGLNLPSGLASNLSPLAFGASFVPAVYRVAPRQQSSFPSTPILDNFNRADGGIGSSWTNIYNSLDVASNQVKGNIASDNNKAFYNTTFGPDVESYLTVTSKSDGAVIDLLARITDAGSGTYNGYYVELEFVSGSNNDLVRIYRLDNNTPTQLGATITQEFSKNDAIGLEMIGSTLKVYRKPVGGAWAEISSGGRSDSTYSTAGYLGIDLFSTSLRGDNFGGGSVSASPTNTPTATATWTNTPIATQTPTPGPSPTPTVTNTPSPTVTNTPTSTSTPAVTNTPTRTPTSTATATRTPTPTQTFTSTPTAPPPFSNATFIYDGDGKRVKSTINGTVTTYFAGTHYEVTGSTITKYYYAGAQRIAMRTNGTLNYLLGDHLGGTSLTTNVSGQVVSELRYKAWGETRYASGNTLTQYQYTGQYSYANDFGLLFYNARWYDSSIGRFAQADTIIPQNQGVQAWDRYAYSSNNPIRYADPSGHCGLDFILGLFGVSYSCPVSGNDWIEGFDPAPEDIGLEINVPVEEVNDIQGFDPVPEDDDIQGFDPAPEDNDIQGFDPVPDNDQLKVIASTEDHHIATNKNFKRGPQWSNKFKEDIFDSAGMDLNDPANIVSLPGHEGPHPQSYHQWVYDRLSNALKGIDKEDQAKLYEALKAELKDVAQELLDDPDLLNGP